MALLALAGKISSGKDTVGNLIKNINCENNWEIKKFAAKLKETASLLTGIPVEKFEDQDFKNTFLDDHWNKEVFENKTSLDKNNKAYNKSIVKPMTVREMLQIIGTEAMRNSLHPDTWVNALMCDYKPLSDITKSNTYNDNRLQHGYKGTKIWRTYHNIKQRCTNTKHPRYNDYGGRNINMCEEWLNDISSFINWAIKNNYNENLTIDRIDNNKGYFPDNCRCVSYAIQATNTNLRKDNTSGYRGVSKDVYNWRAQIQIKGKQKFLGYFNTAEEASEAYENAFMEREGLYLKEEKSNLVYPSWCITDMRFPNEMQSVKANGGITIRVVRPCLKCGGNGYHKLSCSEQYQKQHESETALDNVTFDYEIINDGTLEDLKEKVEGIILHINLNK